VSGERLELCFGGRFEILAPTARKSGYFFLYALARVKKTSLNPFRRLLAARGSTFAPAKDVPTSLTTWHIFQHFLTVMAMGMT
jgi:hypothetical protein